jgi:hypothetical protein
VLERGRAAADALASELMKKLVAELREGGPAQAVHVCSEVAQEIAASQSKDGLHLRRVSLKVRNPQDTPDAYERAILEQMEQQHRDGELPEETIETVVEAGQREIRYMRPIVIQEQCLACHGERAALDPEIRAILGERYPDDQAVGYRVGDLRGATSVIINVDGRGDRDVDEGGGRQWRDRREH